MSDVLRVDADGLRAARPAVEALGDAVDATLARLASVLDAEGRCWGDDEIGHAFGDGYRSAQHEVRTAFGQLAGRLLDVGEGLTRIADVVDAADDRARERLS